MNWRRAVCGLAFLTASMSGWACGEDDGAKSDGSRCPPDNPECKELATVEAGAQAVVKRKCVNCHGQNLAGSTTALPGIPKTALGEAVELYPPNLTSAPTGAAPPEKGGRWTDDALALAIRAGVDAESQALCPQMKHFSTMSDFEVYSIVKYLRDIPPVANEVPRSVCPPTKGKEQQSL